MKLELSEKAQGELSHTHTHTNTPLNSYPEKIQKIEQEIAKKLFFN